METIVAIILFSIGLFSSGKDEQKDKEQAVYTVRSEVFLKGAPPNILERTETWVVTGTYDIEEDPNYFREIKISVGKAKTVTITKEAEWSFGRKVATPRSYSEYFWLKHPNELVHGESTIGHHEERLSENSEVRAKWPLFISVRALTDNVYVATMTTYASNGIMFKVTESYTRSQYYMPIERIEEMLDITGKVLSRTTTTRTH